MLWCDCCCPVGLVEAWAGGASWQDVMADTSLDDGDMARLLARTADMLKQVCARTLCMPFGSLLHGRAWYAGGFLCSAAFLACLGMLCTPFDARQLQHCLSDW
jgi:hypothetical protein